LLFYIGVTAILGNGSSMTAFAFNSLLLLLLSYALALALGDRYPFYLNTWAHYLYLGHSNIAEAPVIAFFEWTALL